MNRLQSYYEQLKVSLKVLFVASAFIAFGSILSNPYLNNIIKLDNDFIVKTALIMKMGGGIILSYFPFYVFVKLLSHEKNEQNIVVAGIMAYLVFLTTLILTSNQVMPNATYVPFFTFTLNDSKFLLYKTGVFGIAAIYVWVRFVFKNPSKQRSIATGTLMGSETYRIGFAIVGGGIIGYGFSQLWPLFLTSLYSVMKFIATDANNPMSLFAYGALERFLSIGNLSSILHQEFWIGEMGGSWMNLAGNTFVGDVNIWAAQLKETVNAFSAGRFTSGYYVLNLFAVPGYLIALWGAISNKRIRSKNLIILFAGILISVFGGVLLPVELLMLLTSPTLLIFHIFMTSFIYAVLRGFSVALGFSYFGNFVSATPGNVIDLIGISQNAAQFSKVIIVLLLGVIVFIAYYGFSRFYFSRLAMDILNTTNQDQRVDDFAQALGGYANIEAVSSTLTRLHVEIIDKDLINVSPLHRDGVVRIVETRQGFILSIGTASYIFQRELNAKLKQLEQTMPQEETKTDEL